MYLLTKVNRMQVSLAEMSYKLHGWHARRKCDDMHCVCGMLEEGVSTGNKEAAGWRRCDHKSLRGRPEYYIK